MLHGQYLTESPTLGYSMRGGLIRFVIPHATGPLSKADLKLSGLLSKARLAGCYSRLGLIAELANRRACYLLAFHRTRSKRTIVAWYQKDENSDDPTLPS
jgi:hypothetical protein